MAATVLLVEDSEDEARLMTHALEADGFTVVTAWSAQAALGHLAAQALDGNGQEPYARRAHAAHEGSDPASFDCIVLDYRLPDSEGLEGLRRIRDANPDLPEGLELLYKILQDHPGLPVIVVTAWGSEDLAVQTLKDLGATDYVSKHGKYLLALRRKVAQAVAQRQLRRVDERLAHGIFVGREREMEELCRGVQSALSGRGGVFMLVGEPGIGKTKLAEKVVTFAQLHGMRALWGRCHETPGARPYRPWAEMIRAYLDDGTPDDLISGLGAGAAYLAPIVSDMGIRFPDLPPPPRLDPESARFRLFESIVVLLKNAARRQPLILLFDDLHWGDAPSVHFLHFLTREIGDARLMVVASYRDAEIDGAHPLADVVGNLRREPLSQTIHLRGLSEDNVRALLAAMARQNVPSSFARAIWQRTEGNPFFIEEFLRHLVEEGTLYHDGGRWTSQRDPEEIPIPEGVQYVIERRLSQVSVECRQMLGSAAVIGREFELRAIERLTELPAAEISNVIDEAIAKRVIRAVPVTLGRYRFFHALICETLYENLTPAHREALHCQIGSVLENLYAADLEPHIAELAYHFCKAAAAADTNKAVAYSLRAAKHASALMAHEEAARHYTRALRVLEVVHTPDEGQRCELLLLLSETLWRAGEFDRARTAGADAADIARKEGSATQLAHAALHFAGQLPGFGAVMCDDRVVRLLEEALGRLGKGESALHARVMARLAEELTFAPERERRRLLGRRALDIARQSHDPTTLATVLQSMHWALWSPEKVDQRQSLANEIVQLAATAGDRVMALDGHLFRCCAFLELGDIPTAREELGICARLAREIRQPYSLWLVQTVRICLAFAEGRLNDIEPLARKALELGEQAQNPNATLFFGVQLGTLWSYWGRFGDFESGLRDFLNRYPMIASNLRCSLARAYIDQGREADARREFEAFAADDFASLPRNVTWATNLSFLAQVCAFLHDDRRAAKLYDMLLPFAGRNVMLAPLFVRGAASHFLGLLAMTMERWEAAERHFEDALEMNARMGTRHCLARSQLAYAHMLSRRGEPLDDPKALHLLDEALEIARDLGLRVLEERVRKLKLQRETTRARRPDAGHRGANELERGNPRDYAIEAGSTTPVSPTITRPLGWGGFVGRERELDQLRAGVEDAMAGCGRLFLLVGEPGIGKTKLAEEAATHARLRGLQVLWGYCHEAQGAPTYWPWIQVIRAYVQDCSAAELISILGSCAADIAQLVPEMHAQLPDVPSLDPLESEHGRFRLFDAVTTFFKNAAKRRPLVVILDDLHVADKPSLLLLQFVVRHAGDSRILLIGTYRDEELTPEDPLFDTLGELGRGSVGRRVQIQGLSKAEVGRYIEVVAGIAPSEALVAAVVEHTEGNPLFAGEVVRLLASEGRLQRCRETSAAHRFTVPQSVREVIGQRLNRLSAECNQILTTAAVVGTEFRLSILQQVSDFDRDQLLTRLDDAIAARIVTEVSDVVGRYRFCHVLTRDVLYERATTSQRASLHRRIGEALAESSPPRAETHLAELAYHFFEAARDGDTGKAVQFCVKAGDRSAALMAHEEAARLYGLALQALELGESVADRQRCELLLTLSETLWRSGDFDKAKQTALQAVDVARTAGASELLASAALAFAGRLLVAGAGVCDEVVVALLDEALCALRKEDTPLRAMAMGRLAQELIPTPSHERRWSLGREAVEMARRVGDEDVLSAVLKSTYWALWDPVTVQERLTVATELVEMAQRVGDRTTWVEGHMCRLFALMELGDIAGVRMEFDVCDRLAKELRQPYYGWLIATARVCLAFMEGRLADAEQLAWNALRVGQKAQNRPAGLFFAVQLGYLFWFQGRFEELESVLTGYRSEYPLINQTLRCALAAFQSEQGRTPEARAEFERLAANDFSDLSGRMQWLTKVAFLTEVCAFLGDAPRAKRLYELLLPFAGRNLTLPPVIPLGSGSHYLGLLAGTMGQWEEAARHFEDALRMNASMGIRQWLARTQVAYADMLLKRRGVGGDARAEGLLIAAAETAQELGMPTVTQKMLALKKRVTPAPVDPDTENVRSLNTMTQRQVSERGPPVARDQERRTRKGVFRKEGEFWTIEYDGVVCRLKDIKGLHHLAYLLSHPGQEFPAHELRAAVDGVDPELCGRSRLVHDDGCTMRTEVQPTCGPLLDKKSKADFKHEINVLRAEEEEAKRCGQPERAALARAKRERIEDELIAAARPGGKDRVAPSSADGDRVAVFKAIRKAKEKIRRQHPALGDHLHRHVETGQDCVYKPDLEHPIVWEL